MRIVPRILFCVAYVAAVVVSQPARAQSSTANSSQSLRDQVVAAAALLDRSSLTLRSQPAPEEDVPKPPITDPEELDGQIQRAGAPTLKISGRIQFRYTANVRNGMSGRNTETGFTTPRLLLSVSRRISDVLSFYGETSASRSTGQFSLSTVFVTVRMSDNWSVRIGKFRPPFLREQFISSGRQLAVERSLVSSALGQGSGTGVRIRGATRRTRFYTAIVDRSRDLGSQRRRWAGTARLEYLLVGSFRRVRDFSPDSRGRSAILLGSAVAYQFEDRPAGRVERTRLRWTGDVSLKRGRGSAFISITGAHITRNDKGASLDQFGLVAQGAYRMTKHWEAFARGEFGIADEAGADLALATIGVNAFFFGRNAIKFSADIGYAFTQIDNFWAVTRAGFLTDTPGLDGQLVLRTQIQVTF